MPDNNNNNNNNKTATRRIAKQSTSHTQRHTLNVNNTRRKYYGPLLAKGTPCTHCDTLCWCSDNNNNNNNNNKHNRNTIATQSTSQSTSTTTTTTIRHQLQVLPSTSRRRYAPYCYNTSIVRIIYLNRLLLSIVDSRLQTSRATKMETLFVTSVITAIDYKIPENEFSHMHLFVELPICNCNRRQLYNSYRCRSKGAAETMFVMVLLNPPKWVFSLLFGVFVRNKITSDCFLNYLSAFWIAAGYIIAIDVSRERRPKQCLLLSFRALENGITHTLFEIKLPVFVSRITYLPLESQPVT